jgi:hypothetical protein
VAWQVRRRRHGWAARPQTPRPPAAVHRGPAGADHRDGLRVAGDLLDRYAGIFDSEQLGDGDYVLCSDEKTSIQARCRCHPTLPPGKARMMRVEHEYDRGGAVSYLAAWDVHRGKVFGRCEPTTGIARSPGSSSRS